MDGANREVFNFVYTNHLNRLADDVERGMSSQIALRTAHGGRLAGPACVTGRSDFDAGPILEE